MASKVPEEEQVRQVREQLAELRRGLSDEQAAALDEFALDHGPERNACIRRYLRAHRGVVRHAAAGIQATVEWRVAAKPDEIDPNSIMHLLEDGRMYVSRGKDKERRPIIINIKSASAATDHGQSINLIAYTMERAIMQMRNGVEKWVWIMDMKEYSSSTSPPSSVTKATIALLSTHYPERLHRVYIVNAPWYFRMFWNVISVLVDAVTKSKVRFLSIPDGPVSENFFSEDIELDQLEERFGGKMPNYVFNRDDFLPISKAAQDEKEAT